MSAANWIKLHVTVEDLDVINVSSITGEDRYTTLGRIVTWLHWVDQNCVTCNAHVTLASVTTVTGLRYIPDSEKDFGKALVTIGWMNVDSNGEVVICGFKKHFGKSAKVRALTAKRVARLREKRRNASNALPVTHVTQLDKSTLKSTGDAPPSRAGVLPRTDDCPTSAGFAAYSNNPAPCPDRPPPGKPVRKSTPASPKNTVPNQRVNP